MKMKHYYDFSPITDYDMKNLDKKNWDYIRTNTMNNAFAIESSHAEFAMNCNSSKHYNEVADIICKQLKTYNTQSLVSFGVGKAQLEFLIKEKMPNLHLICTDFAPNTVNELRDIFIEADTIEVFDLLEDDFSLYRNEVVLLNRLSAEFTIQQWEKIFINLENANIEYVYFIPESLLNIKTIFTKIIVSTKRFLLAKKYKKTFCGWIYSASELRKIWSNAYTVEQQININDHTKLYVLKLNRKR